jgi:transcription antitermination factor NusG
MQTEFRPWYALLTQTKKEASVLDALRRKGIECLLPVYLVRSQWSDRRRSREVPLFPGYVFCTLDLADRSTRAIPTPGAIRFVEFGCGPATVPPVEMRQIERIASAPESVVPWAYLEPGRQVRIEHGPFRGLEGVVIQAKQGPRLIVSLPFLQRSVAVEIERHEVTPLRAAATWT